MIVAPGQLRIATPSDREILFTRVFDAPRTLVWECHTRPELVQRWLLGPPGWSMPVCEIDLRIGGRLRYEWRHEDGRTMGMSGVHREIVAPERLVTVQVFDDDWTGGETLNTQIFTESGGQTTLSFTVLYSSKQARDGALETGMSGGMEAGYRRLDDVLATPSPEVRSAPMFKKIAFTMYPVTDVARARKFYEETFGLTPGSVGNHGDGWWVEYDLPGGGCLALTNFVPDTPSDSAGGTIAFEVEDLDRLIADLKQKGVSFKSDVIHSPVCRMAVCRDSEGNAILLHQLKAQ